MGEILKISGAMRNWGRWSDIVAVRLPDIISVEIMFEKILSIIVFASEVTYVGRIVYGKIIDEARVSKNSLVGVCCSYFEGATL